MVQQRSDVVHGAREEVVDTDYIISAVDQLIAEVRANKAGSACHNGSIPAARQFDGRKSHPIFISPPLVRGHAQGISLTAAGSRLRGSILPAVWLDLPAYALSAAAHRRCDRARGDDLP